MKRIAALFLLIFCLVQVAPAFQSLVRESKGYVFNIDEEKHKEKATTDEKKQKKDYPGISLQVILQLLHRGSLAHRSEQLLPPPHLEKPVLPPNC